MEDSNDLLGKKKSKKGQAAKKELTPEETIAKKKKILRKLKEDIVIKLLLTAGAIFVTFTFIFGVTVVETDDMYPAIRQGDVAIYFRLGKDSLMNSDVVMYEAGSKTRIGRIEACPGSVINRTNGGKLTIDGNMQPIQKRSGLYYETETSKYDKLEYPSTVPSGSYLILGDKRSEAVDSRQLGYIQKTEIKGKVFTILRRRAL